MTGLNERKTVLEAAVRHAIKFIEIHANFDDEWPRDLNARLISVRDGTHYDEAQRIRQLHEAIIHAISMLNYYADVTSGSTWAGRLLQRLQQAAYV